MCGSEDEGLGSGGWAVRLARVVERKRKCRGVQRQERLEAEQLQVDC